MELSFYKAREFDKWIETLGPVDRAKIVHMLVMLEEADRPLGMPQGRDIKHGLWELRSRSGHRVYYTPVDTTALVLNQGRKDTQQRDIELARKRMP